MGIFTFENKAVRFRFPVLFEMIGFLMVSNDSLAAYRVRMISVSRRLRFDGLRMILLSGGKTFSVKLRRLYVFFDGEMFTF